MKLPTKRIVRFHGAYKDDYYAEDLEVYADSIFTLFNIIFVEIFPTLKDEKHLSLAFEDVDGNMTEIFDPEQELHENQIILHVMPNPDGAELISIVYAVIVAIVAIGVAMIMSPKIEMDQASASGSNWETPENVVGQGGIMQVVLGERLVGSRVASYGIDSTTYRGKYGDATGTLTSAGSGGGSLSAGGIGREVQSHEK